MAKRPYRHYSHEELFKLALHLENLEESAVSTFFIEQLALVDAEIAEREWETETPGA